MRQRFSLTYNFTIQIDRYLLIYRWQTWATAWANKDVLVLLGLELQGLTDHQASVTRDDALCQGIAPYTRRLRPAICAEKYGRSVWVCECSSVIRRTRCCISSFVTCSGLFPVADPWLYISFSDFSVTCLDGTFDQGRRWPVLFLFYIFLPNAWD